jgi:rare lipoprotein A
VKLRFSQLLCIAILAGALLVISDGYAETKAGLASWYGPGFEGQPTASGEPFNPYGFTAAHNTLPLGTKLVVSYGGRAVEVVVNDRGPYSGGRELDLSQGAAEYLGLTYAGVDYVDYTVAGGYGAGDYGADDPTYAEPDYAAQSASEAQYSSDGQGASGGTYVVQAGDTLSSIAAERGTTVEELAVANGIENPDLLYAGQTLRY